MLVGIDEDVVVSCVLVALRVLNEGGLPLLVGGTPHLEVDVITVRSDHRQIEERLLTEARAQEEVEIAEGEFTLRMRAVRAGPGVVD